MRVPAPQPGEQSPSLHQRVRHGLGLIILATVLLLGVGVTIFVYRIEQQSWQSRQAEAATYAAQAVADFVQHVQDHLALVSQLERGYLEDHPQVLSGLLGQLPPLLEIARLDAEGAAFAQAYRDVPLLGNLSTAPGSDWFLQARSGRPHVGQVQIPVQNEPYVVVAIPAPDGGVTAARLRMAALWEKVSTIRLGETGQAYVVNHRGEVVAHPDPGVVGAGTTIAAQPELQEAVQAPGNRWQGTYTNFAGARVVGSTSAVPGTDWIVFAVVSQAEVASASRSALFLLGGVVVLFGILLLVLADRLMQRLIFAPVERLRAGAQRIGQGDLQHRIGIAHRDELGQVAEAFDEMAAHLQDREAALRQARDEALEASRFKTRLLANVGHDLRTPLNAILGYADMLQEGVYGELGERQRKANERILSNAKRLLHLINSLLDQAQIDAGTLQLHRQAFAPAELLRDVEATMGLPAETKGLTLTTEIAPGVPATLVGDVQRIHQIVTNLVENAIKFTPEGGIHLRLYLPGDGHWAIAIADTGPGIPSQVQDSIFEPFRRLDESPTREHSGVGLGLSLVKQLTTLMGGRIELSSQVGRGSTFVVQLPLDVEEEPDPCTSLLP